MGRTFLAETAVQHYVDSLTSLHDSAVGLVIGQVTIEGRRVIETTVRVSIRTRRKLLISGANDEDVGGGLVGQRT